MKAMIMKKAPRPDMCPILKERIDGLDKDGVAEEGDVASLSEGEVEADRAC